MTDDPRIGKEISHYKIIARLGGGGMGVVYKAEDVKLKRTVALKFLALNLLADGEIKKRFVNEARAASALDHPRIGTIYEVDETPEGEMFIAMAYYEGRTLKDRIVEEKIPPDEVLRYTSQIANGLAAAHNKGIIHRDVKPANIMLTEDGFIKIVDFGLAKLGDVTQITAAGTSMGTPAYMSPEQAKGEVVDHRCDIWALGVIFYEMFTGTLPFRGDDQMSMMFNIVNQQPDYCQANGDVLPEPVREILAKALSKDVEQRYGRLEDMIKDINGIDRRVLGDSDTQETVVQSKPAVTSKEERAGAVTIDVTGKRGGGRKGVLAIAAVAIAALLWFLFRSSPEGVTGGYLQVNSEPQGAEVQVAGHGTHQAPAVIGPIAPDEYDVTFSLEGHEPVIRQLRILAGDTLSHSVLLAPAVKRTSIEVSSHPEGADILLDGRSTDKKTPSVLEGVAAGEHQIELSKEGYRTVSRKVTTAGDGAASISFDLEPLQKEVTRTAQPEKERKPVARTGSVAVRSDPKGAAIILDGSTTGKTTPSTLTSVDPGEHALVLELPGYGQHRASVSVVAGEKATVDATLKQKPKGSLTVVAVVLRDGTERTTVATIFVDGQKKGQTPGTIALAEGKYEVDAKLFEHQAKDAPRTVTVRSGAQETVKFQFVKK